MDPESFDSISTVAASSNHWKTDPINIELFPTPDAIDPISFDLVATLGHKLPHTKATGTLNHIHCNSYWFPSMLSSNSSQVKQQIIQFFAKPCSQAGFSLVSGKMTSQPLKTGLIPLRLVCSRSRIYERNKKSQQKYSTKTSRPKCSSKCCPFAFTVYFDPTASRWLLPRAQGGCPSHSYHPKLDLSVLPVRKASINLHELELVFQQLQLNINPSLVSKLFAERTGTHLTPAQIRKFRHIGEDLVIGQHSSPADKLMHHLNSDPSIHYIALTASYSMNKLVTIRQSHRDCKGVSDLDATTSHGQHKDPMDVESPLTFA